MEHPAIPTVVLETVQRALARLQHWEATCAHLQTTLGTRYVAEYWRHHVGSYTRLQADQARLDQLEALAANHGITPEMVYAAAVRGPRLPLPVASEDVKTYFRDWPAALQ